VRLLLWFVILERLNKVTLDWIGLVRDFLTHCGVYCLTVLKPRRFAGVADAEFDDAADNLIEFSGKMDLAHNQNVQGIAEMMKMEGKQNLSWKSSMMSSQDDDFLMPGSNKRHASTSEGTDFSDKMGLPESRAHKSGNKGTTNAVGGQKVSGISLSLKLC
jgi:hypothetical protein